MKPLSPRNWSRSRLFVVGIMAAALCVAVSLGVFVPAAAGLALVVLLDRILLTGRGLLQRENFRLALNTRTKTQFGNVLEDREFDLDVCLAIDNRISGKLLLVPFAPPGIKLRGPPGMLLTAPFPRTQSMKFRFCASCPGIAVFPGILLRICSPLRLFTRTLVLERRHVVPIFPDLSQTRNARIGHLLRPHQTPTAKHTRRLVGLGTEFHKLRDYHASDARNRVDWKATARIRKLTVREYEEPRELSIHVLLDGSLDLLDAEFRKAGSAVAKLACVANVHQIRFGLTVYDDSVVLRSIQRPGIVGLQQLLTDLISVRRRAIVRHTLQHSQLQERSEQVFRRMVHRWGVRAANVQEFLRGYLGRANVQPEDLAEFIADFSQDKAYTTAVHCPKCGLHIFADESCCAGCQFRMGSGQLSPRTACLVSLLSQSIIRLRGRGILFLASAFRGGETNRAVLRLLTHANSQHTRVHVALPWRSRSRRFHPLAPGSLGGYPATKHSLENLEIMYESEQIQTAVTHLHKAGISVHDLEDLDDLDDIVSHIISSV